MYGLLGQQAYGLLGNNASPYWYQTSQPYFGSGRAGDIRESFYNAYGGFVPSDYQVGGIGLISDLINPATQDKSHQRLLKPEFYENFGTDPLHYL